MSILQTEVVLSPSNAEAAVVSSRAALVLSPSAVNADAAGAAAATATTNYYYCYY